MKHVKTKPEAKIRIRDFSPEDAKAIVSFREETGRISFPTEKMDKASAKRSLLRHAERFPGTIKVAECSGSPVGYIMFRIRKGAFGPLGHINIIFVKKPFREHGVGALLLKEAEKHFRKSGITHTTASITMGNRHSLSFFKEHGFKEKRVVVEKKV